MESHSGVAYSGWLPTSRYSLAPFSRNTLLERPQLTTRLKRYRATSSGLRRRWPRSVQVTPYSFSSPKILRSTEVHGSLEGNATIRPHGSPDHSRGFLSWTRPRGAPRIRRNSGGAERHERRALPASRKRRGIR